MWPRVALAGIGAVLCLVSAGLALRETEALRLARTGGPALFLRMSDPDAALPAALGLATQSALLDNCAQAQLGLAAGAFPAAARKTVAQTCLAAANRALRGTPVLGVAHYAQAASALTLGDIAGLQRALRAARAAAPSEGWLAERRVDLGLRVFAGLDDGTRAALWADAGLLASDPAFRPGLARRYLRHPEARAWITAAVEDQPEAGRRGFLAAVRAAAE